MYYFNLLCVILTLAAFTACFPEKEETDSAGNEKKPVPVHVTTVKSRELPIIVETLGRLAPDREVNLAAEVGGVIQKYFVDRGDRVSSGQILTRIDPTDYRLALEEAEANLEVAKAHMRASEKGFERIKELLPKKVVTHDAFEKSEADYNSSKATVERMKTLVEICKERLKKTEIMAPFSGLIASRLVEKGQTVGAGQSLFTLVDMDPMRVRIFIVEKDYVHLDMEDPVSISIDAIPDRIFKGRVDRIGIKADERTNTFDVDIIVDNPDMFLKAGMSARVYLTTMVIPDVVMIPQSTILYRNDRKEVFILEEDNKAEPHTVELGRSEGSLIRITKGLKQGDRLITRGGQYLNPGDRVLIVSNQ